MDAAACTILLVDDEEANLDLLEAVLRQLRAAPRTAQTPIIVISADATPKTVERLLAQGANAYLTKPLKVRQFLRTLDDIVSAGPAARPGRDGA